MPRHECDPFAALRRQVDRETAFREMVGEAIEMIDMDRPNMAKRHLVSALGFGPDKRLEETTN